jgi:hypothetical protein
MCGMLDPIGGLAWAAADSAFPFDLNHPARAGFANFRFFIKRPLLHNFL